MNWITLQIPGHDSTNLMEKLFLKKVQSMGFASSILGAYECTANHFECILDLKSSKAKWLPSPLTCNNNESIPLPGI